MSSSIFPDRSVTLGGVLAAVVLLTALTSSAGAGPETEPPDMGTAMVEVAGDPIDGDVRVIADGQVALDNPGLRR